VFPGTISKGRDSKNTGKILFRRCVYFVCYHGSKTGYPGCIGKSGVFGTQKKGLRRILGKSDTREIDFVAQKQDTKIYIQ
jgi:hypothetical protein